MAQRKWLRNSTERFNVEADRDQLALCSEDAGAMQRHGSPDKLSGQRYRINGEANSALMAGRTAPQCGHPSWLDRAII
jgi:hypothetical protein